MVVRVGPTTLIYYLVHALLIAVGVIVTGLGGTVAPAIGTALIATGAAGAVIYLYISRTDTLRLQLEALSKLGISAAYDRRAAQIRDEYATRLAKAKVAIDVIGFGLSDFRRDYVSELPSLASRDRIRILLIDPIYPDVTEPYCHQPNRTCALFRTELFGGSDVQLGRATLGGVVLGEGVFLLPECLVAVLLLKCNLGGSLAARGEEEGGGAASANDDGSRCTDRVELVSVSFEVSACIGPEQPPRHSYCCRHNHHRGCGDRPGGQHSVSNPVPRCQDVPRSRDPWRVVHRGCDRSWSHRRLALPVVTPLRPCRTVVCATQLVAPRPRLVQGVDLPAWRAGWSHNWQPRWSMKLAEDRSDRPMLMACTRPGTLPVQLTPLAYRCPTAQAWHCGRALQSPTGSTRSSNASCGWLSLAPEPLAHIWQRNSAARGSNRVSKGPLRA